MEVLVFYQCNNWILNLSMGSGSDKPATISRSLDEKEETAIRNVFHSIVTKDPGSKNKIESIEDPNTLNLIYSDFNNFLDKLHAWMIYWKENLMTEEISK